jgi:UDP-N-acetyl-D-galactosamine dehydrogenase
MRVLAMLAERGRTAAQARVLVLGVTFKEDCPDLRNSRALELAQRLADAGAQVDVSDPWVGPAALADAGVRWLAEPKAGCYDAVVLAVAHASFKAMDEARIRGLLAPGGLVYDVKSAWPRSVVDDRL